MDLTITFVEHSDHRVEAAVSGDLDLATVDRFVASIEARMNGTAAVVVDASGLTFLDSSGLRALLMLHQRCRDNGGSLRIQAVQPKIARVLEIAGVRDLLDVRDG